MAVRLLLIVCFLSYSASSQPTPRTITPAPVPRSLTTDDVVREMVIRNDARVHALLSFEGTRHYTLDYTGFPGGRHAEMVVNMRYRAPDTKEFIIVSQSGSAWLVNHVLKRLLESEAEGTRNRSRIDLNPNNYDFTLIGYEGSPAPGAYVLSVEPKNNHKYLYRGKIWVDPSDFAVTRIEAEPAVSPSFWTKSNQIHYVYGKVGEFWLPRENHTVSNIRFGGRATLTIEYRDYRITSARAPSRPGRANARLPLADTEE